MRRRAGKLLCAVIGGALAGCGGGAGSSTPAAVRSAVDAPPGSLPRHHEVGASQKTLTKRLPVGALSKRPAVRVGRWTIRLRVMAPRSAGAITFGAGRLRPAGEHGVEHKLLINNTGRRPVTFADTRSSRLLGASGRGEPLAGDEGCGYAQNRPGAAIEPNVCRSNLDAFVVAAGGTVTRTVTLFWKLPGAGRLTPGTYVFRRPVRFAAGRRTPDGGRGHAAVVRLRYTVSG